MPRLVSAARRRGSTSVIVRLGEEILGPVARLSRCASLRYGERAGKWRGLLRFISSRSTPGTTPINPHPGGWWGLWGFGCAILIDPHGGCVGVGGGIALAVRMCRA